MNDKEVTELRLDESNELFFKISVHGAERAPDSIRLVCEVGDISYSFKGKMTDETDVVRFVVPALKNTLRGGQIYEARVEVIVDDHYFVPVKFNAEFKEPMKVVAESITPISRKTEPVKSEISIQAKPVSKAQYASLRDKYKAGVK